MPAIAKAQADSPSHISVVETDSRKIWKAALPAIHPTGRSVWPSNVEDLDVGKLAVATRVGMAEKSGKEGARAKDGSAGERIFHGRDDRGKAYSMKGVAVGEYLEEEEVGEDELPANLELLLAW